MDPDTLRLFLTFVFGGAGFVLTVVTTSLATYKFIQKEIEKKLAKHYHHEHVIGQTTIRDRLVECRRHCPAINPTPGGGGHDTRGQYAQIGRR